MRLALFLVSFLLSCAESDSCTAYADAASRCAGSAGADATVYDADVLCGEWTAQAEEEYGGWYRCQAQAWEAADCTGGEGFAAAAESAEACALP